MGGHQMIIFAEKLLTYVSGFLEKRPSVFPFDCYGYKRSAKNLLYFTNLKRDNPRNIPVQLVWLKWAKWFRRRCQLYELLKDADQHVILKDHLRYRSVSETTDVNRSYIKTCGLCSLLFYNVINTE